MVAALLALVVNVSPLEGCPDEQRAVRQVLRDTLVSGLMPATGDDELPPFAEEALKTWRRVSSRTWRMNPEPIFGRSYRPSFLLRVDGCGWLLVERGTSHGGLISVRARTNLERPGLAARVAALLGLPLASATEPQDGAAIALTSQRFVVFDGVHPVQRASLVEGPLESSSSSSSAFAGWVVPAVRNRVSPIARLFGQDVNLGWSVWKVTFGAPRKTGFYASTEDAPRVVGECVHSLGFTLSLRTGAWVAHERASCEGL